jgi:hypothetical protein
VIYYIWHVRDSHVVGCDLRNLTVATGTAHLWLNEHECVEMSVVTHSSATMLSEP